MKTIKNSKSKLFNGINIQKINELEENYKSLIISKIQCMEDNISGMLRELIENETNLSEDEIDENYDEIMETFSIYNWDSRFGLKDEIKLSDVIQKLDTV
jgi:hypothetical protein